MQKFKIVFGFELRSLLFKKAVIVSSIVIAIVSLGLTFVPRFAPSVFEDSVEAPTELRFDQNTGLFFEQGVQADFEPFIGYATIFESEEALKAAVADGDIESGIAFHARDRFTEYRFDTTITAGMGSGIATAIAQAVTMNHNLAQRGLDPTAVQEALNINIESNVVALGTDGTQGVGFVYIFILVTYMLILLYGMNVSTSVAREKDDRTMELLITSTKPTVLILGKVFAAGLVGILQIGMIGLATVIGLIVNRQYIPDFIFDLIGGNLSMDVFAVFLVFSVLGYILYLFIYAALGSLVSKVEDVNSSVQPVTFIFVIAYFVAMMAFSMPDAQFVRISSYIPFVSLFTMPIRFMLTTVSILELIIALGLIVATTVLIAQISIYIYRSGSLNYGNKMKLKDVFKAWRQGH